MITAPATERDFESRKRWNTVELVIEALGLRCQCDCLQRSKASHFRNERLKKGYNIAESFYWELRDYGYYSIGKDRWVPIAIPSAWLCSSSVASLQLVCHCTLAAPHIFVSSVSNNGWCYLIDDQLCEQQGRRRQSCQVWQECHRTRVAMLGAEQRVGVFETPSVQRWRERISGMLRI